MGKTKRLNFKEKDDIIRLAALRTEYDDVVDSLGDRAMLVKGGKRDLALIRTKLQSLLSGIMETVEPEQQANLMRNARASTVSIGARCPATRTRNREYGIWMSFEEYNTLAATCNEYCKYCTRETFAERKGCELRKVIHRIAGSEKPDRPDGDCPYYGV